MNDIEILLEMKKKIDRGEYDKEYAEEYNTVHTIQPMLIIPPNTLDKMILDALNMKD